MNERTLDLPSNTALPFFTYGIFKPGQLAHSKIRNHIDSRIEAEINYPMRIRDGVPILLNKENERHLTKGYIINFKENREETAYNIICKTLLSRLYEWKTITINKNEVNVLFGVDPSKGSNYIDDSKERINYDGKNDPLFSNALKLIENNLNSEKDSEDCESECFFELQMNYMLLWSAIDRYSSLKYNQRKEKWNRERFAKEKTFKDGIYKFKDAEHIPVYSTDDLVKHEFNVDKPYETLNYFYTLRCNVVHRGKSMRKDYYMLKQATKEMLEIFNDVLNNAFNEI